MKELIKITENNGNQVVSARELCAFLEIKNHFTQWIKDNIHHFEKNVDYQSIKVKVKAMSGFSKKINYALRFECA